MFIHMASDKLFDCFWTYSKVFDPYISLIVKCFMPFMTVLQVTFYFYIDRIIFFYLIVFVMILDPLVS